MAMQAGWLSRAVLARALAAWQPGVHHQPRPAPRPDRHVGVLFVKGVAVTPRPSFLEYLQVLPGSCAMHAFPLVCCSWVCEGA